MSSQLFSFPFRNNDRDGKIRPNYLITQQSIPMPVQDELRARLLPDECTADINRIFIHTEGSVRAQPGELVSSHHYPRARACTHTLLHLPSTYPNPDTLSQ